MGAGKKRCDRRRGKGSVSIVPGGTYTALIGHTHSWNYGLFSVARRAGAGNRKRGGGLPRSRDPRRRLMKEETPIGGFHNRLQSNGFQREFLKKHGAKKISSVPLKKLGSPPLAGRSQWIDRRRVSPGTAGRPTGWAISVRQATPALRDHRVWRAHCASMGNLRGPTEQVTEPRGCAPVFDRAGYQHCHYDIHHAQL